MAVSSAQVSVATTATAITTASSGGQNVVLSNQSGAAVFLGNSLVTTSNGMSLAVSSTVTLRLAPREVIYGVVATGTQSVHVLVSGA